MKILKLFIFLALFISLGLGGFICSAAMWINENFAGPQTTTTAEILIEPGANQPEIASLLKNHNVIKSALLFRLTTRFLAVDHRLKPNVYSFKSGDDLYNVIFRLLKGNMPTVQVTIPEGVTLKRVAAILSGHGICSEEDFIREASNPELIRKIFPNWDPTPGPEGLVFPDTYIFFKLTPAEKAAERMLRLTKHQIDRIFPLELPGSLSHYQGCILASIVESEAALAEERKLIASVFYNRLDKGIKLESCATVLYAIGGHKSRVLYEDLKVDSPYNTYLYQGLPPSPIANFGAASMMAVANPEKTDYLFFVSNGNRGHSFSKSLNEHNKNWYKFFQKRKEKQKND